MMTFIVSGRMGTICRNVGCCSKVEMKFWYATKTLVMSSLPRMVVVNSAISLSEMPSLTLVCVVATSYPRVEKYSPPLRPKAYTTRSSFFRSRSRSSLSTLRTTPLLSAPASPLSLVTTMSAVLPGRSCMSGWRAISAVPERRSKTESAAAAYERPESARSCPLRIFTAETASIALVTVPVFLYERIFDLMLFRFAILEIVVSLRTTSSYPLSLSKGCLLSDTEQFGVSKSKLFHRFIELLLRVLGELPRLLDGRKSLRVLTVEEFHELPFDLGDFIHRYVEEERVSGGIQRGDLTFERYRSAVFLLEHLHHASA